MQKSKTVHSFDELSQEGVHALINDIVMVYIYYCRGSLIAKFKEELTAFSGNRNFFRRKEKTNH